jgi:hypothetical protein
MPFLLVAAAVQQVVQSSQSPASGHTIAAVRLIFVVAQRLLSELSFSRSSGFYWTFPKLLLQYVTLQVKGADD